MLLISLLTLKSPKTFSTVNSREILKTIFYLLFPTRYNNASFLLYKHRFFTATKAFFWFFICLQARLCHCSASFSNKFLIVLDVIWMEVTDCVHACRSRREPFAIAARIWVSRCYGGRNLGEECAFEGKPRWRFWYATVTQGSAICGCRHFLNVTFEKDWCWSRSFWLLDFHNCK